MSNGDTDEARDETLSQATSKTNILENDYNEDETKERMTKGTKMLYTVAEVPPGGVLVSVALQNLLTGLRGNLFVAFFISEIVCVGDTDPIRAKLLCTSLFMTGICTIFQCLIGVRLPIFQGVSSSFIIPLLAMRTAGTWTCDDNMNSTKTIEMSPSSSGDQYEDVYIRLREMMGCLMLASLFEMLIGMTGLLRILMRFIGPLTIATVITLIGLTLFRIPMLYARAHWGLASLCIILAVIFMLYLDKVKLPVPVRFRKKNGESHLMKLPVFQMFPVMLSILITWFVCGILTVSDVLPNDPSKLEYKARTDSRIGILPNTPWFFIPYPGQFGLPLFNISVFVGFQSAVITSILESIGDYYTCAYVCNVPKPPAHAVSRGIFLEGIGSLLSGAMGAGHATTSSTSHLALISISKVASRSCLTVTGILCVFLSVIGKFGAVLSTLPYPVVGGGAFVGFGLLTAIGIFMLRSVNMSSFRNLAIFGLSLYIGMVIPEWIKKYPAAIDTGSEMLNGTIKGLLGTSMFLGGIVSLILDNTVKGTLEERGMVARETGLQEPENYDNTDAEAYNLPNHESLLSRFPILKHSPMFYDKS